MLNATAHPADIGSMLDISEAASAEEPAGPGKGDGLLDGSRVLRYARKFSLYFLLKTLPTCLAGLRLQAAASFPSLGHSPFSHVFAI